MKKLLLSLLAIGVSTSVFAAAGKVIMNGKFLQGKSDYVQRKNGGVGEYQEKKRDFQVRVVFQGTDDLNFVKEDKTLEDKEILGVDVPGRSEAKLVKGANGEILWHQENEFTDEKGVNQLEKLDFEFEFTKGDWAGFEKGDAVTLVLTKKARESFVEKMQQGFIALAKGVREDYQQGFPSAKIGEIKVDGRGSKGEGTLTGDAKNMSIDLPSVWLDASLDATW